MNMRETRRKEDIFALFMKEKQGKEDKNTHDPCRGHLSILSHLLSFRLVQMSAWAYAAL